MNELAEMLNHPLVWPISAALSAGAVAYLCSRHLPAVSRMLAVLSALLVGIGVVLAAMVHRESSFAWTWIELTAQLKLTVEFVPTTLGLAVAIGAAGFSLLVAIYSLRAMAGSYWEGKFHAYLIWALAGAVIVALAGNLFVLLVGWELVTLMLYLMVNQGQREAAAGAAKTYGVLGFGDACLLLALALLAGGPGGSANWSLTSGPVAVSSMGWVGYAVYVLVMLAALAKAGAIPVHTWIPSAARDAPTPVMALLPAAVDKLLGIYLLAVLVLRMFQPDGTMQVILMVVGAVTILAAVLMAMMQHNLKRLLSFHAVSQVGYMVLGIGTGTTVGVIGGLFHMLNHAIYKCDLFLMSGAVGRAAGTDEIEQMGGLARRLPVTFVSGLIAAAAISGIPPFNGFVSKWLVYQGTLQVANRPLAAALLVAAVFGSALTLASFVKVIHAAFLSPAPAGAVEPAGRVRESVLLAGPMVVLAAACVLLGLWPQLAIDHVLSPSLSAARTTGQAVSTVAGQVQAGTIGLWNPTQATGLILIGLLGGLVLVWVSSRRGKVRLVRPFLGGEVAGPGDDRFRVPGTQFYETVARMPLIGPLLTHGEAAAFDPYHWAGRHGNVLVQLLRAWHGGLLGLYVAWCVVGLVVTLGYLWLVSGS